MRPPARRPAHAAAGRAVADDGWRLADEFYGLYSRVRLMLVHEFEDKGVPRADAVAAAQAFLNRLMLALFVGARRNAGAGGLGDGIARVLEGGTGDGTRRVWDYIVGSVFGAPGAGRAQPSAGTLGGGLFEESLHKSAFFPDKRGREFFAPPGARSVPARGAPPEYRPRIAEAVRGSPGLNPAIEGILGLCSYDFQSQVSVDMLGSIFESSVTDLEVLLGRRAAARRRDGIFYTPGYVTDYICSRTIAGYLSPSGSARDPAGLVSECAGSLDDLEERLGRMRILDPACGSGAFLTGAARALIRILDEIARHRCKGSKKTGSLDRYMDAGRISGTVRSCIYGIDTSPHSVDIARLSLLLLAAPGGEKPLDLSANVVVGNSVVEGPDRGGLDWEAAFPAVFDAPNPGFSVILGNPPYVRQELLDAAAKRAMARVPNLAPLDPSGDARIPKTSDLSAYFYYHSLARLRRGGRLGFISSDNWLRTEYGGPLRRALLSNSQIEELVSPRFKVFPGADVNTVIVLLTRRPPDGSRRVLFANAGSDSDFASPSLDAVARIPQSDLGGRNWSVYFEGPAAGPRFPAVRLGTAGRLRRGIGTGRNDFFVLSRDDVRSCKMPPAYLWPVVSGGDPPCLGAGHAKRYVMDVRDGKDELAKTAQGRLVKKYIEHGEGMAVLPRKGGGTERVPLPELPTIAGRNPWYSLPVQDPPPIFISRINDRTIRVHENRASGRGQRLYQALDTHLCFTPDVRARTGAFLAYFASSCFALDMEKSAAPLGGGGLRIDNRVMAQARVPDFDELPPEAVQGMDGAWSAYCDTLDRERLDTAVFAALGMARHLGAVRAELDRLVDRRMRTSKRAAADD